MLRTSCENEQEHHLQQQCMISAPALRPELRMRARGARQHEYEHRADPLFRRIYVVSPTLNSLPFFLAEQSILAVYTLSHPRVR